MAYGESASVASADPDISRSGGLARQHRTGLVGRPQPWRGLNMSPSTSTEHAARENPSSPAAGVQTVCSNVPASSMTAGGSPNERCRTARRRTAGRGPRAEARSPSGSERVCGPGRRDKSRRARCGADSFPAMPDGVRSSRSRRRTAAVECDSMVVRTSCPVRCRPAGLGRNPRFGPASRQPTAGGHDGRRPFQSTRTLNGGQSAERGR